MEYGSTTDKNRFINMINALDTAYNNNAIQQHVKIFGLMNPITNMKAIGITNVNISNTHWIGVPTDGEIGYLLGHNKGNDTHCTVFDLYISNGIEWNTKQMKMTRKDVQIKMVGDLS